MKKIMFALLVFSTMSFRISFAESTPDHKEVKVSQIVRESLMKEFPDAEFVRWEMNGDYFVASFNHGMGRISVYLDEMGGVYSITRYIKPENLPMSALKAVMEKYDVKDSEIVVMEVSKANRTYYLFNFIKSDKSYIIESDASGNLQVVKKNKIG